MYATANEYLRLYKLPEESLLNQQDVYLQGVSGIPEDKHRIPHIFPVKNVLENIPKREPPKTLILNEPEIKVENFKMKWNTEKKSTSDPKVWGPAFWFSLHTSAAHYPENPSQIVRERMKNRILAIPYEVPCSTCRPHASSFIEANRDNLDKIVSNKHELGKFYVDFHNKVNERYGKKKWTYEDAYKKYSGDAEITYLEYK